mmetsp:Transcript_41194/g.104767  ORF Transcript_41194/g.104767 Transcript_41194/m.104767 type:complete len:245 (-) Transcript_41194:608-1342(-)
MAVKTIIAHQNKAPIDSMMENANKRRLWKAFMTRTMRKIRTKRKSRNILAIVAFEAVPAGFTTAPITETRTSTQSNAFIFHSGPTKNVIFSAHTRRMSSNVNQTENATSKLPQKALTCPPAKATLKLCCASAPTKTAFKTIIAEAMAVKGMQWVNFQMRRFSRPPSAEQALTAFSKPELATNWLTECVNRSLQDFFWAKVICVFFLSIWLPRLLAWTGCSASVGNCVAATWPHACLDGDVTVFA